jgi:arabinose-5-phosphate isomerase
LLGFWGIAAMSSRPAERPKAADPIASALRTLAAERDGIAALSEAIGNGLGPHFAAAVELMAGTSGRIIVTGMGKSGHVGRKFAATLASTGTPAYFVHPAEASHGDLGMIQPQDVIIALSWSGETTELSDILAYAKRYRVKTVAVTANALSALARQSDIALVLPSAQEACPNGLAPTTSTTMQMVLGDALAVALLEARGFSAQDFRLFHPGGRLGAQLKQVRDVMHTAHLPIVRLGTRLDAAYAQAAAARDKSGQEFGSLIVVDADGKLAGIVTDGDLRRHLGPDLVSKRVDDLMTRTPRTLPPDALLATALEIQESRKITMLIVVEDDRPVGLVRYLDLLRAGVA